MRSCEDHVNFLTNPFSGLVRLLANAPKFGPVKNGDCSVLSALSPDQTETFSYWLLDN